MPAATKARVWKFGEDINTDLIFPNVAFLKPEEEQPRYCFSANRPGWSDQVKPGDLIVGGRNFGTGSGRPIGKIFTALKVGGIVADTFNGLGLRNCINYGLPTLPCPGITKAVDEGDTLEVDWNTGVVKNLTKGTTLKGTPIPRPLLDIVDAGGVMAVLKREGYIQ